MTHQEQLEQELIVKMIQWMKKIENEVNRLIIDQHIYQEVQKIVNANAKIQKPSSYYEMVSYGYAMATVMGIRRLVDDHKDAISFVTLLDKLGKNQPVFCRKWYVGLWGDPPGASHHVDNIEPSAREGAIKYMDEFVRNDHLERANKHFDRYSKQGEEFLDLEKLEGDKRKMIDEAKKIQEYADMRVAHHDRNEPSSIPTYNELDECIKLFEEMCVKYNLLIKASSPSKLLPTWQYDWKAIFYDPWIELQKQDREIDASTRP
jgi:hypothetical protein